MLGVRGAKLFCESTRFAKRELGDLINHKSGDDEKIDFHGACFLTFANASSPGAVTRSRLG